MLEAERAGAKALVVFMEDFPRGEASWKALRTIQAEETHNCALIGKLLDRAGVAHSHGTGEFYDKAVAVKGRKERIAFLVRGLEWAIREFDSSMKNLEGEGQAVFTRMRDSHLRSIAACESLLRNL